MLLRIPGTPAAVATTFDGYPMAQKGEGGFALQVAVVSSSIGGIASGIALMVLAPPLPKVTLLFGPSEVFWVAVFGLASIIFLLGGLQRGLATFVWDSGRPARPISGMWRGDRPQCVLDRDGGNGRGNLVVARSYAVKRPA
ncbi:tripartite tricarboxylate transporter permease [Rhizobium sp. PAMB 3174]